MPVARRSHLQSDLSARILSARPGLAWKLIAGSFAALLVADVCTPRYITFGTFYLVLTAYTRWVLGHRAAWTVAAFAIAASIAISGFGSFAALAHGPAPYVAIGWSLATRLLSSGAVVELVGCFRRSFDHEKRTGEADSLTGLFNRRAFMSALHVGLSRTRSGARFGVVA